MMTCLSFPTTAQESNLKQPTNKDEPCGFGTDMRFSWSGGCRDGLADGYGRLIAYDENGNWWGMQDLHVDSGMVHGYVQQYADKEATNLIYSAFYQRGILTGEVFQKYSNGSFSGEKYDSLRNGYGVYWFENDTDERKKAKLERKGKKYEPGLHSKYMGHWKDGGKDGFGEIYFYSKKTKDVGVYKQNRFHISWRTSNASAKTYLSKYKSKAPARKPLETIHPFIGIEDIDYYQQQYTAALKDNPEDFIAFIGLAGLAYKKGNFNEALSYYNQALENSEESRWANYFRACTLEKLGDYDAALADIRKVTRSLDPGNINAWYLLGKLNFLVGDYDQAHAYLDWVNRVRPKLGHVLYYLALTNKAREERHTSVLEGTIFNGLNQQVSNNYPWRAQLRKAERYLEEAGDTALLVQVLIDKGKFSFLGKNYFSAIPPLEKARSLDSTDMGLNIALGHSYLQVKKYEEAAVLARILVKNPETKAEGEFMMGNIMVKTNKMRSALNRFKRATSLASDGRYFNNLAVAKIKMKEEDGVCADFQSAAENGIDQNYFYLTRECGFEVPSKRCQSCKGEGRFWDGSRRVQSGSLVKNYETCTKCDGQGKIYETFKSNQKLEWYFN